MKIPQMVRTNITQILGRLGYRLSKARVPYSLELYDDVYGASVVSQKPFYNIGAGAFYHPYWCNVDFASDWYKPHQTEMRHYNAMALEPLPIETATAELIYSSHMIEHISYEAVLRMCEEAFRCLKPGGIFRLTTGPDAETDFRALQRGDTHWFYWDRVYEKPGTYESIFKRPATDVPIEERWLHHVATQLAPNDISPSEQKFNAEEIRAVLDEKGLEPALEYFTSLCSFNPDRPGNHMSWWTHDRLLDLLKKAGFADPYRSGFNQSASPVLRHSPLFDSKHPQMSIYVEAIKQA
jgi:SAM-dependent methyltransferase